MRENFKCPECGKQLFVYETAAKKYGDMVKTCKHCDAQYLDPRFRELAIDGLPKRDLSVGPYIFLLVIGGLLIWRGIHLFGLHEIGVADELQWLLPTMVTVFGIALVIGGIIELILVKTGRKKARFMKLLSESEQRMNNISYVNTLIKLGYDVPERFRRIL